MRFIFLFYCSTLSGNTSIKNISGKNDFMLSSSTKCEIIIPTITCPYVSLFIILKANFKNKFDLFCKITDVLTYPQEHLSFNSIEDLQQRMDASFFFSINSYSKDFVTRNKLTIYKIKTKQCMSASNRLTAKTV